MNAILNIYKPPKLNQGETNNLNKSIILVKHLQQFKNLSIKKYAQGHMDSSQNPTSLSEKN